MSKSQARREIEFGYVRMYEGLRTYIRAQNALNVGERKIGECGFAGEYILDMLRALEQLLSVERGSLDGQTWSRKLHELADEAGISREAF